MIVSRKDLENYVAKRIQLLSYEELLGIILDTDGRSFLTRGNPNAPLVDLPNEFWENINNSGIQEVEKNEQEKEEVI